MKRAVQIIVFLCVISVVNAYGNTDRWLSMEANTVDTENNNGILPQYHNLNLLHSIVYMATASSLKFGTMFVNGTP